MWGDLAKMRFSCRCYYEAIPVNRYTNENFIAFGPVGGQHESLSEFAGKAASILPPKQH
jgi:hypothetical protein